jgi:leader peptidase (prepilin peptidase)/N-methyltransferase
MHDSWMLVAATLLGAIVGSFLNVVVFRLPRDVFLALGPRSVCPHCRARIAWFDNLPVVSWLLLRGRARCCGQRIPLRYPLIEITTAAAFLSVWLWPPSGLAFRRADPDAWALAAFGAHAAFLAILIACTWIDLEFRILPDELTKSGMVLGVLASLLVPGLGGRFELRHVAPAVDSLLWSLSGLGVGLAVTFGIRLLARAVFRKEAMGFGDVKLMGAIGAFLGPDGALLAFFAGCLLGAFGGLLHRLSTGDRYVPFGPFLAAGAAVVLFLRGPLQRLLLETWPEWIRENLGPRSLLAIAVACVVSLFVLVRRGRDH